MGKKLKMGVGLLDLIYPVNSIYMSVGTMNPSVLFGGKWEQIKDRFLLSAGDIYLNGTIGGEKNHTLTISEMPSHLHRTDNDEGIATAKWQWVSNGSCFLVGDNQPGYQIRGMGNSGGNQSHIICPLILLFTFGREYYEK